MPVTVVIAEDDLLVREGLQALLTAAPEIEVLATCVDEPTLLAAVERLRPDVLVTDIRMPPSLTDEGIRAAERLRAERPELGVVVLSQYAEAEHALRLVAGGSARRAYLRKDRVAEARTLVDAVRTVAAGGTVLDPELVDRLVSAQAAGPSPILTLTPRERQVLEVMAGGASNAAIARELHLSERAIEKHSGSIFLKLGLKWEPDVSRRVKAVLMFLAAAED